MDLCKINIRFLTNLRISPMVRYMCRCENIVLEIEQFRDTPVDCKNCFIYRLIFRSSSLFHLLLFFALPSCHRVFTSFVRIAVRHRVERPPCTIIIISSASELATLLHQCAERLSTEHLEQESSSRSSRGQWPAHIIASGREDRGVGVRR